MNRDHWIITITKGVVAAAGGGVAWFAAHADSITAHIGSYGGALVVVLTAVSICFDIRRKWRNRNKS